METSSTGNHPDLAKKLKLLYNLRLNPGISSHTELAAHFGISKQAISRWMHGSETRRGNCIPGEQLQTLSELLQVKQHWFALSYEEFKQHIFDRLEQKEAEKGPRPEKISISQLPCTSPEVFGREREVEVLNNAWNDKSANVLQIVAFGGVGKSSLINYWLASLNENNYRGAKQVYAWSFYWQGASSDIKSSGDFFIEHALNWFGDEASGNGTPWAKASRLANLVRQSRTLLILDGLEPLQNPPGQNSGLIENPAVSFFIKEMATDNNGLCVITTRLPVKELNSYFDNRVLSIELGNPSIDAAKRLLKIVGVNGSEAELTSAVNKYACHPLSLKLLGGYLNIVYQGKIQQARNMKTLFEEENQSHHAKNIMEAYFGWFKDLPELEILSLIALIDRATTLDEIKAVSALNSNEEAMVGLRNLTIAQLSYAITRLCDAHLIAIQVVSNKRIIECHPLVKEFALLRLKENSYSKWIQCNKALFKYYRSSVTENPESIVDLDKLFRAVIHGTQSGLFKEAFQLYFYGIKNGFTMLSRGSHYTDLHCINAFFTKSCIVDPEMGTMV